MHNTANGLNSSFKMWCSLEIQPVQAFLLVLHLVSPVACIWNCLGSGGGCPLGLVCVSFSFLKTLMVLIAIENCGWNQTTDSPLVFPSTPGNYSNHAFCKWTITAPEGQRIKATFKSLGVHIRWSPSGGCTGDYMQVSMPGAQFGQYCYGPPEPITTTGGTLYIEFHSDLEGTGKGFAVEFEPYVGPVELATCGGHIKPHDSIRVEPQWGRKRSLDCKWTVIAPAGKVVEARVSNFTMWWDEIGLNPCPVDYLQISPIGHDIARYCGHDRWFASLLKRIVSSDNVMEIDLHTEARLEGFGGFHIELGALDAGSVITQQFVNLYNHFPTGGSTARGSRDVTVRLEQGPNVLQFFYNMVAQLVHESNRGPVSITVLTHSGNRTTFLSECNQSWIILQDGLYEQDGSSNLSSTKSTSADIKWDINKPVQVD